METDEGLFIIGDDDPRRPALSHRATAGELEQYVGFYREPDDDAVDPGKCTPITIFQPLAPDRDPKTACDRARDKLIRMTGAVGLCLIKTNY
ncbi:MAG TPA: hypothetical protein VJ836_02875 [Candidatus Saccharimonadales bacterium]|nr:hypothetical protein [Candidatus Saccharimonadales bacterium]